MFVFDLYNRHLRAKVAYDSAAIACKNPIARNEMKNIEQRF